MNKDQTKPINFAARGYVKDGGKIEVISYDIVDISERPKDNEIFTKIVGVKPKNGGVFIPYNLESLSNYNDIKEDLELKNMFGELCPSNFNYRTLGDRIYIVDNDKAIIRILDLYTDNDNLKVNFEFLDNDLANDIKERYLKKDPKLIVRQRYTLNFGDLFEDEFKNPIITLITIDIVDETLDLIVTNEQK